MQTYIDTATLAYPLYLHDIKRLNPEKSIPKPPAVPAGYALVESTPQPAFDAITQGIREGEPQQQGGAWAQAWEVVTLDAEQIAANVESARAGLIEAVTSKRWQVETGGITLPDGTHVFTGTDDQNRITSVIANAAAAGVESVDFKAPSGWVTLTMAEMQGVASVIALHVQACFTAERAHHEAIALLSAEVLADYDIDVGWPA